VGSKDFRLPFPGKKGSYLNGYFDKIIFKKQILKVTKRFLIDLNNPWVELRIQKKKKTIKSEKSK